MTETAEKAPETTPAIIVPPPGLWRVQVTPKRCRFVCRGCSQPALHLSLDDNGEVTWDCRGGCNP